MSSSTPAEVTHIQSQDLQQALNELDAALGSKHIRPFHRLALQQLIRRHIFHQTGLETLPLQQMALTKIKPMATDFTDSFLRQHARELGWTGIYNGPREVGVRDMRDWGSIDRDEQELIRAFAVLIFQLLQIPADKNEWSELYLEELRDAAKQNTAAASATEVPVTAAREVEYLRRDLGSYAAVQSEPETSTVRARGKLVVRRSKNLVRGLSDFVGETEEAKSKRTLEQREKDLRRRRPAEPMEASDSSTEGTQSDVGDGSEAGKSEASDGSERCCERCGETFASQFELMDHLAKKHLVDEDV